MVDGYSGGGGGGGAGSPTASGTKLLVLVAMVLVVIVVQNGDATESAVASREVVAAVQDINGTRWWFWFWYCL